MVMLVLTRESGKEYREDVLAVLGSGEPGMVNLLHYPAFGKGEALRSALTEWTASFTTVM